MESSSTVSSAVGRAVDAPTVTEALRRTAANHPEIVAVRTPDDSVSLTWSELLEPRRGGRRGLAKLGVGRGDTVAIMLGNRPSSTSSTWRRRCSARLRSRSTDLPAGRDRYLIDDAASKVAIVEQAHMRALLEARKDLPGLEHVIVVDGEPPEGHDLARRRRGLEPGLRFGRRSRPQIGARRPGHADLHLGHDGAAKGVQLTHRNVMSGAQAVEQVIRLDAGSRVISWLPAAHIAERMAHHYIPVIYSCTVTCCPNPREVSSYLPQVRPTWFFAVPRIWEKLKAGLETMQAAQPEEQRRPIQEALAASIERVRLRAAGRARTAELEARSPRPTSRCSPSCARCSASTRRSRSTSAPRRPRSRCSSSSTRSGSRWLSCGGCPRRAGSGRATGPARCGSARSGPP